MQAFYLERGVGCVVHLRQSSLLDLGQVTGLAAARLGLDFLQFPLFLCQGFILFIHLGHPLLSSLVGLADFLGLLPEDAGLLLLE